MKKFYIVLILFAVLFFTCSPEKKKESSEGERVKAEKKIQAKLEKVKNVQIKIQVDMDRILTIINDVSSKIKLHDEIGKTIQQKLEEIRVDKKTAIVLGDLKTVGIAIEAYTNDLLEVPKVESFVELKKVKRFVDGYIKKLPLKDPWGNYYFYKYDKNNPKKYWIASAGKDGKFDGFEKKKKKPEKNDDIILTGDAISLGPAVF